MYIVPGFKQNAGKSDGPIMYVDVAYIPAATDTIGLLLSSLSANDQDVSEAYLSVVNSNVNRRLSPQSKIVGAAVGVSTRDVILMVASILSTVTDSYLIVTSMLSEYIYCNVHACFTPNAHSLQDCPYASGFPVFFLTTTILSRAAIVPRLGSLGLLASPRL